MSKITESMILECYEVYKAGRRECFPEGMNESSARMTMYWLDSMLRTYKPDKRNGSYMQHEVVLKKIKQDFDSEKARKAALTRIDVVTSPRLITLLESYIDPAPSGNEK
jgi:hypothetical protein